MSIVLNHLLFTPVGPDQPWCVCVSTWWNAVLCQQLTCISLCPIPFSTDEPTEVRVWLVVVNCQLFDVRLHAGQGAAEVMSRWRI